LPLPDQEEELPLKDVEQLLAAVVNMARWAVSWGARRLEESDSASCFLAGCFKRYGPCPDGLAFAWPEDDTLWGVRPLISRIRFTHSLASPLEVGTTYIIFLSSPIHFFYGPTFILKHTTTRRIASAEGLLTELPRALTFLANQLTTASGWGVTLRPALYLFA
jgi:hypothetical protein